MRRKFIVFRRYRLFVVALAIALLSVYQLANAYHQKDWPFNQGYYLWLREKTDLTGSFKEARLRELAAQSAQAEQVKKTLDDEKYRLNHLQDTALHRLRVRLIDNVPEGQIHILSESKDKVSFLLLTLQHPKLMRGELDLSTLGLKLDTLIETLDPEAVRGTDVLTDARTGLTYVSMVTVDERKCGALEVLALNLKLTGEKAVVKRMLHTDCVLPPYIVLETGGRMALDDSGHLFLTVGDFGKGFLAEDKKSSYGKILVSQNGSDFHTYSSGHRNPQGLFYDSETRRLIQSEHGPQGGDEINNIEAGKNYGWPSQTYGTNYGSDTEEEHFFANKGNVKYGTHDLFEKPMYAYLPSIGTAEISRLPRGQWEFPDWYSDYLLAGMANGSLNHLKLEGNRVVFSEPMPIGRIRSFEILPSGKVLASRPDGLVLLTRDDQTPKNG
jgi:hypothetical protein